ncbi:hypothetical protein TgHK011_007511 [Trichoderma gracile]|nr:hypothetical protein TgHK011_007511 [Trichoderma gracile]
MQCSESSRRRGGAPCKAEVGCRSYDLFFWSRSFFFLVLFSGCVQGVVYFLPCVSTSYKNGKKKQEKEEEEEKQLKSPLVNRQLSVAQPQLSNNVLQSDGLVRGSRRTASNSAREEEEEDHERVAEEDAETKIRSGGTDESMVGNCGVQQVERALKREEAIQRHPPPSGLGWPVLVLGTGYYCGLPATDARRSRYGVRGHSADPQRCRRVEQLLQQQKRRGRFRLACPPLFLFR